LSFVAFFLRLPKFYDIIIIDKYYLWRKHYMMNVIYCGFPDNYYEENNKKQLLNLEVR
jgi:hypothetical protein